jgi:hypothetical protein
MRRANKNGQPIYLRKSIFAAVCLLLAIAFFFLSRYFYQRAGKPEDFVVKIAEYALEIAVLVLFGAFIKEIVDWLIEQRARRRQEEEKRADLFRRLRDVHVKIMYSRDLIRAHRSAKTWTEQCRQLMQRIPELEEIVQDLRSASNLFREQARIESGIDGIIEYLRGCREEYINTHPKIVTLDDKETVANFTSALREGLLPWYTDFHTDGSDKYDRDYDENLTNSKGEMRLEAFGSTD